MNTKPLSVITKGMPPTLDRFSAQSINLVWPFSHSFPFKFISRIFEPLKAISPLLPYVHYNWNLNPVDSGLDVRISAALGRGGAPEAPRQRLKCPAAAADVAVAPPGVRPDWPGHCLYVDRKPDRTR